MQATTGRALEEEKCALGRATGRSWDDRIDGTSQVTSTPRSSRLIVGVAEI